MPSEGHQTIVSHCPPLVKYPYHYQRYDSHLSFLVQQCAPQSAYFCGTKRGTDGMGQLTDRSVKTVGEGRHGDGDGLQLIVSASGRRKWVLRYQLNGVRRDMGLGPIRRNQLVE